MEKENNDVNFLTKKGDYDSIFVRVKEDEINNNNIQNSVKPTYLFWDMNNNCQYKRITELDKSKPQCDLCLQIFDKYGDLYSHKSRSCYLDFEENEITNPIVVMFNENQLTFIGDALESKNLTISDTKTIQSILDNNENENENENENNKESTSIDINCYNKCFIIDKTMLEITLRRLYMSNITKYNLEEWYEDLEDLSKKTNKSYTAKTIILKLSDEELLLISRWNSIHLSQSLGMNTRPTNSELEQREILEDKINQFIHDNKTNNNEDNNDDEEKTIYFCKFSTRSPKDSKNTESEIEDINERLQHKINKLKVTNGQQVFNLLTHSQRIFSDINFYFQYRIMNSSSGYLGLILREWVDIPQDHEFRVYVHQRKITAISQYQCYCKFNSLQNEQHILKIRDSIISYHEEIKNVFKVPSYVIDVVCYPDTYNVEVIELNPFGSDMSSGSALYNWEIDEDLIYDRLSMDLPPIRILEKLVPEGDNNSNNINKAQ